MNKNFILNKLYLLLIYSIKCTTFNDNNIKKEEDFNENYIIFHTELKFIDNNIPFYKEENLYENNIPIYPELNLEKINTTAEKNIKLLYEIQEKYINFNFTKDFPSLSLEEQKKIKNLFSYFNQKTHITKNFDNKTQTFLTKMFQELDYLKQNTKNKLLLFVNNDIEEINSKIDLIKLNVKQYLNQNPKKKEKIIKFIDIYSEYLELIKSNQNINLQLMKEFFLKTKIKTSTFFMYYDKYKNIFSLQPMTSEEIILIKKIMTQNKKYGKMKFNHYITLINEFIAKFQTPDNLKNQNKSEIEIKKIYSIYRFCFIHHKINQNNLSSEQNEALRKYQEWIHIIKLIFQENKNKLQNDQRKVEKIISENIKNKSIFQKTNNIHTQQEVIIFNSQHNLI